MPLTVERLRTLLAASELTLSHDLLGLGRRTELLFSTPFLGAKWRVTRKNHDNTQLIFWGTAEIAGRTRQVELRFNADLAPAVVTGLRIYAETSWTEDPPALGGLTFPDLRCLQGFSVRSPELLISADARSWQERPTVGGAVEFGRQNSSNRIEVLPGTPGYYTLTGRFPAFTLGTELPKLAELPFASAVTGGAFPTELADVVRGLDILVTDLRVDFSVKDKRIDAVGATVSLRPRQPWKPVPGLLEVNRINAVFVAEPRRSASCRVSLFGEIGALSGAVAVRNLTGGGIELSGAVEVPLGGKGIPFGEHLPPDARLDSAKGSVVAVRVNPTTSTYAVSVDVGEDAAGKPLGWKLAEHVVLTEVRFLLAGTGTTLATVDAEATLAIGSADLTVAAHRAGAAPPSWKFTGELANAPTTALARWLRDQTGVDLAASLGGDVLKKIALSGTWEGAKHLFVISVDCPPAWRAVCAVVD